MKLVGEYELTEDGVVIEGRINNTHIHDVKSLIIASLGQEHMYYGYAHKRPHELPPSTPNKQYSIPHFNYRPYIALRFPELINPERESKYVKLPKFPLREDKHSVYVTAQHFAHNMGMSWGEGDGYAVMEEKPVYDFATMNRSAKKLLTNSAWVWDIPANGEFKVEIRGLVNKHMMTVLLSNATKLAKYIDDVLAPILDKPELFTTEKVREMRKVANGYGNYSYRLFPVGVTPPRIAQQEDSFIYFVNQASGRQV